MAYGNKYLEEQKKIQDWGRPNLSYNEKMMYECVRNGGTIINEKKEVITSDVVPRKDMSSVRIYYLLDRAGKRMGVAHWRNELREFFNRSKKWETITGDKFDFPEPQPTDYYI